jgi:hypothetical protein
MSWQNKLSKRPSSVNPVQCAPINVFHLTRYVADVAKKRARLLGRFRVVKSRGGIHTIVYNLREIPANFNLWPISLQEISDQLSIRANLPKMSYFFSYFTLSSDLGFLFSILFVSIKGSFGRVKKNAPSNQPLRGWLHLRFECAANGLLKWHAFLVCSKIRRTSSLCEIALLSVLHAALRSFSMSNFNVHPNCSPETHGLIHLV